MITVSQAAARLGMSARRVRVLCEQGRIKAEKVSARLWLIDEPVKIQPPNRGK